MFIYKVFIKKTLFQLKSLFLIFFLSSVLILVLLSLLLLVRSGRRLALKKMEPLLIIPTLGLICVDSILVCPNRKTIPIFLQIIILRTSFKLISQAGMNHVPLRIQLGGLRKGSGFFHEGISDCGRYC